MTTPDREEGLRTSSTLVDDPSRPPRESFTAKGLHEDARELHIGGIRWWNFGWICVLAALLLNLLGLAAIATTEPDFARKQAVFLILGLVAATAVAIPECRLAWRGRPSRPPPSRSCNRSRPRTR